MWLLSVKYVVSVGIVSPESASLLERVEEDSERLSLLGSPTGSAATWLRKPFVLSGARTHAESNYEVGSPYQKAQSACLHV